MARNGSTNGRVWAGAEMAAVHQEAEINAHAADVNHAKWQEALARAERAEAEAAEYRRKLKAVESIGTQAVQGEAPFYELRGVLAKVVQIARVG